jgi:hypothetical protein
MLAPPEILFDQIAAEKGGAERVGLVFDGTG